MLTGTEYGRVRAMFDEQGLYFQHEQKLVLERLVGNRMILTSWKKIPTIRKFLEDCTK